MFRAAFFLRMLLALGLLLPVACGTTPPPVSSVALPAGWQTVTQAGLAFALPPGWEVLAADDGNFRGALDDLIRQNPRLQNVADQARKAVSGGSVKILAFDLAPDDTLPNFTTNLSIGLQQMGQRASLQEVAQANAQQLKANGFTDLQQTLKHIGREDAARLSSSLQINDASGEPLPLAFEQYIVVKDQKQYVLTFTTIVEQRKEVRPIFDQIAGTFQAQ